MLGGCNVVEDLEVILMEVDSGEPELCCADMIIRIDEKECFIDCKNCTVRDIEANLSLCPHRYLLAQEVL